jgi:hypothetical protein
LLKIPPQHKDKNSRKTTMLQTVTHRGSYRKKKSGEKKIRKREKKN